MGMGRDSFLRVLITFTVSIWSHLILKAPCSESNPIIGQYSYMQKNV